MAICDRDYDGTLRKGSKRTDGDVGFDSTDCDSGLYARPGGRVRRGGRHRSHVAVQMGRGHRCLDLHLHHGSMRHVHPDIGLIVVRVVAWIVIGIVDVSHVNSRRTHVHTHSHVKRVHFDTQRRQADLEVDSWHQFGTPLRRRPEHKVDCWRRVHQNRLPDHW